MKKILIILVAVFSLCSCTRHREWEISTKYENSVVSGDHIDHIGLNRIGVYRHRLSFHPSDVFFDVKACKELTEYK